QPRLYRAIKDHPTVVQIYKQRLIEEGVASVEELSKISEGWREGLDRNFTQMREKEKSGEQIIKTLEGAVTEYQPAYAFRDITTAVDHDLLSHVARSLTRIPDNFNINPKIK